MTRGDQPSACSTVLGAEPRSPTMDVTGGAPELNPSFRRLVERARALGRRRHRPLQPDDPLRRRHGVASPLPIARAGRARLLAPLLHRQDNVDKPAWPTACSTRSITCAPAPERPRLRPPRLVPPSSNLVYNPLGAFLPGPPGGAGGEVPDELGRRFGIEFHHLFTLTNMPISRFAEQLRRTGGGGAVHGPASTTSMACDGRRASWCRRLVSVGCRR